MFALLYRHACRYARNSSSTSWSCSSRAAACTRISSWSASASWRRRRG